MIILKNSDTQKATSSSEEDNLDLLLDKDIDNNCTNSQDGALKNVPQAPLPTLQPATPSNWTNLHFTQLVALLHNLIQN